MWATTLFDEVTTLGNDGAHPSFTRALRWRGLRTSSEPWHPVEVIDHSAGGETQRDWVGRPDPPGTGTATGARRSGWSGRWRTRASGRRAAR